MQNCMLTLFKKKKPTNVSSRFYFFATFLKALHLNIGSIKSPDSLSKSAY